MVQRMEAGTGFEWPATAVFYGPCYSRVLVRRRAANSCTRRECGVVATIGFFNWSDTPQVAACRLVDLGLGKGRALLGDFWNGKAVAARDGVVAMTLPPRGLAGCEDSLS